MKATLEFVIDAFKRFNVICFDGVLPMPSKFVISRAKTFLGRIEFKNRISFPRRITGHYDYVLKFSGVVDMDQSLLEDVIIHEMIHYYIAFKMIKDTSAHGPVFRQMMENINRRFGRHIAISHRASVSSPEKNSTGRIVCITTFVDGDIGVTVCAKTRVFQIRKELYQYYNVRKLDWYFSFNTFFERFPRSQVGKAYRVVPAELSAALSGAIELVCDDRSLRRK